MTIELTILISVISVSAALFFGLSTYRRNNRADIRNEAGTLTSINVKLENISISIAKIEETNRLTQEKLEKYLERLVGVEQAVKQAHKRLDDINKK